jgi:hypothetical protein
MNNIIAGGLIVKKSDLKVVVLPLEKLMQLGKGNKDRRNQKND